MTDHTDIPVIYLAGPYRDAPDINTGRAIGCAEMLYREGYAVVSPHMLTHPIASDIGEGEWGHDDPRWLPVTRALVSRCDALAYMRGSEDSEGTQAEIAEARERGTPVAPVGEYPRSERFWAWARERKREEKHGE